MLAPNLQCHTTIDGHPTTVRLVHKVLYLPVWECESPVGEHLLIYEDKLMPDDIPYRLRESKFLRYASVIGAALRAYPNTVEVDPDRVNPDTFVAQYREAITAKKLYHWQSPLVDDKLFAQLADEIRHAAITGKNVRVGPIAALRRDDKAAGTIKPFSSAPPEVEFRGPIMKLEQLCEQITNKWFEPPITFFVRNLDPVIAESLNARYDVMIVPDANDATKSLIM